MGRMTKILTIRTRGASDMVDITRELREAIKESGVREGEALLFVPHTTAAVTINENADSDVERDLLLGLDKSLPDRPDFAHAEGNSHAHIKSSVVGVSETVFIDGGAPVLGTWQGIYFCEFDGPRRRKLHLRIVGE